MTCTIIGLVVVGCLGSPATRLTPAAAAAVLAPHQFVYVPPAPRTFGPTIVLADTTPVFKPFAPPRRLDGSLLSDAPWQVTTYYRPFLPRRYDRENASARAPVPAPASDRRLTCAVPSSCRR